MYGIPHAVDVAHLAGQVEDHVDVPHEVVHRAFLAHVGDVQPQAVLDVGDVEEVAAVVGDERVDQQHIRAEIDEAAGEIAADEPEAARDHDRPAPIELLVVHALRSGASRGALAGRPAPDDERPPQLQDVDAGPDDAAEIEELRLAVRAVVVVHGRLDDGEAGVLDLLHHLQADDAAVLRQFHVSS